MVVQSYTECFWGGDLKSTHGYEAITKRNQDAKKMCHELEDYLKKRGELELKFSKSLSDLAKCFKYRDQIGQLETALNAFRSELDIISSTHHGTGVFFNKQAEQVKIFRDDQATRARQVEDELVKAQKAKLNQYDKTIQLEKTYMKKCNERDVAQHTLKEYESQVPVSVKEKDMEKAKSRSIKAEEEAQKADDGYKAGVYVLEEQTTKWEKSMEYACKIVQELDEKRVRYLRQELWVAVNADSKIALDVDNSCEKVRQKLETCDVSQDVLSFMNSANTGSKRPKHYVFKPHTSQLPDGDSDTESSTSSTEDDRGSGISRTGTVPRKNGKTRNPFSKLQQLR